MIRGLVCLSISILLAQAFSAAGDSAGSLAVITSKRVEPCHIETLGPLNALHTIAQTEGVPIGVEAVLPEKQKTTVFDFPGGTVADLLNMAAAESPGYRWREDNGIIHVSRKGAHVSLTDVFLSYPGAQNRNMMQMWMEIRERPEIREWMESAQCRLGGEPFHAKNFKQHRGPISIPPGSITVAHLLDQIALQSGSNYWAVLQRFSPKSHSCYVSVNVW